MREQKTEVDTSLPKAKRQRMSVVCLNCKARKIRCDKAKPHCTNCIKSNVAHLCQYESPHWVARVTTADGVPITQIAAQNNSRDGTFLKSDTTETIEALKDEVQRLKGLLDFQNSQSLPESNQHLKFNDSIDFFEAYKALTVKRSGMEEHKPLSCGAHEYKDQYSMVMVGYFNLGIAFFNPKIAKEKRKDKGTIKKNRLDASVSESLCMLGEQDSPYAQPLIEKFIQERLEKTEKGENQFPNLGDAFEKSDRDFLKTKIEKSLPPKSIIRLYMTRFYDIIYPHFPFIHKEFFNDRVFNVVLSSDDEQSGIKLNLVEKFDWVLVAMLLILIRLTYIVLPPQGYLCTNERALLNHPIPANFITNALSCLSSFKILRKTKLTIVQCLLYLRVYFTYSPEDGDGVELTQSQILFGIIVQSAYTIGLNRDASHHVQMSQDIDFSNLWRKVWLAILEQDSVFSSLGGYPGLIPDSSTYNVQIPIVLGIDQDSLEATIAGEMTKSQRILALYSKLAQLTNSVAESPSVNDVLSVVRQIENYASVNYSLNTLEKLTEDSARNAHLNVRNVQKLQHSVQSLSLATTTYLALWLHYESKNHYDAAKMTYFQHQTLRTTVALANIIHQFVTTRFHESIEPSHLFLFNRYIQNAYHRVHNTLTSLIYRLYHATDMISRGIASTDNSTSLTDLTSNVFKVATGMLVMMQNTLGREYYVVFKASLRFKFYLRSIKKDGFKCIRDTISFINNRYPGDPTARVRLLERVRLKLDPDNLLNELDNLNNLVSINQADLDQFSNLINDCAVLKEYQYTRDGLIWDPSFKDRPNYNTPSFDNILSGPFPGESPALDIPSVNSNTGAFDPSSFNFEQLLNDTNFLSMDIINEERQETAKDQKLDWLFKL